MSDWKKDFDETFVAYGCAGMLTKNQFLTTKIKDFIENLIAEERKKVVEEILSDIEARHRLIKGHFLTVDEYNYIKQKYKRRGE